MTNKIKLLIVSDLHAIVDPQLTDDSHFLISEGCSEYADAFLRFVKEKNLDIDVMICPGDIANKSDEIAFSAGWKILNKIKEDLNIKDLLCVPGNHDHKSRKSEGTFDPKHQLQFQNPSFPLMEHDECTHFWAWHWCAVKGKNYNAILLNTSAYHGYADEHNHGRIAIEVVEQVIEYIKSESFEEKPCNFLVCHHHPVKMEFAEKNYDSEAMEGGDFLLRSLSETDKGNWLTIHGHKHFPEISYAQGSTSEPVTILSAGSISAVINPEIIDRTGNQFYILEIDLDKSIETGRVVGIFETFEWTLMKGWSYSESKYLPARGGFGSSETPSKIANKIKNLLNDDDVLFLEESDLNDALENVKYFVPTDFRKLISKLKSFNFEVIVENNKIVQVGKS